MRSYTFLIMERFHLKHTNNTIYFTAGIAIFSLFLYSGLYFMLPLNDINPFEYFFGADLNIYNIINIFTGGSVIPLIALIVGYILSKYQTVEKRQIAKYLAIILGIIGLSSVLIFPFDNMLFLVLMTFVSLIFVGRPWVITFAAGIALFAVHLLLNVVLEITRGLNSNIQHVYSGIQQVNEYISIYRSSDYLAIINQNIDYLTGDITGTIILMLFMILPWLLIGVGLHQLSLETFMKDSPYLSGAMVIVLLTGGILTKLIQILLLGNITGETLGEGFGGPVLALGYFLLLMYAGSHVPKAIFKGFVNLGRQSLSAYILFNVLMMFIFFGFGLALYGQISVQVLLFIVLGLYCLILLLLNFLSIRKLKLIEAIFR